VCSHLYAFDTLTYTWHKINTQNNDSVPKARDMASITVVGSQAYLFGGYDGNPLDDMHTFQLKKQLREILEQKHVGMRPV